MNQFFYCFCPKNTIFKSAFSAIWRDEIRSDSAVGRIFTVLYQQSKRAVLGRVTKAIGTPSLMKVFDFWLRINVWFERTTAPVVCNAVTISNNYKYKKMLINSLTVIEDTEIKKQIPVILFHSLLFVVLMNGLVNSVIGQSQVVQYAPLQKGQLDCVAGTSLDSICRVRRMPSTSVLQSRLNKKQTSWQEGNEVVFALQKDADAVNFYGGRSWAMTRVPGTDYWALILQIPEIKRATVSYQFMVSKGDDKKIEPAAPEVFRGSKAPPAPRQTIKLRGRLSEEAIQSTNLSESRSLTVYSPPLQKGEQIAAAVYLADGKAVELMAPYVEPLIVSRRLPPILLVGVHHGKVLPGDPNVNDFRGREYLIGFGETDERFEAHERFVIEEVLPWAEAKFNAPKDKNKRAVFGASNGGSFAVAMGIRHPEVFGHIIAFSPTWSTNYSTPSWKQGQAPSQYLLVGTLESANVHKLVEEWSETAKKGGAKVTLREPVAGHDAVMWREWFVDSLLTEFGRTSRAAK